MKVLLLNKSNILIYLICFVFLSSIIQFGQVLIFNPHIFEISIIFLLLYNIFSYKISNSIIVLTLLYLPILVLSIINSIIEGSISNFIVFIFYYFSILACFLCGYNLRDDNNILKLVYFYSYISLIINILGFLFPNKGNVYFGNSGIFINPNVYGLFCSISFVFLYLSLSAIDNSRYKIYIKVILLVNFFGVISSVSRTALSSLVIALFTYYFLNFIFNLSKNIEKKWIYSVGASIILCCVALYLGALDKILKKSSALGDDISNGRFDLWKKAYNSLKFYGYGHEYYGVGESATHNNYLNIGVVFGASVMIALILFWIAIVFNLIYLYAKYRIKFVLVSISIFVFSLYYWLFEVGSGFVFVWMALLALGYSQSKIYDLKH